MIELEICCGSVLDAKAAACGGASRIELNSALPLGGLTPDIGSFVCCKESVSLPIIAMLRPRGGGFCYSKEEFWTMQKSGEYLLREGADGLAFGFLTEERDVDIARTRAVTEQIHAAGKEAVFHRAFDCVRSFAHAIESLIEIGVDRVLTSGGARTALEGAVVLAQLQAEYGSQIEILPGSGVRGKNVAELLTRTGVRQVHSSCGGFGEDWTARGNGVSFSYEGILEWYCYEMVSIDQVKGLKQDILQWEKGEQNENL